jgi:hypothetical protein
MKSMKVFAFLQYRACFDELKHATHICRSLAAPFQQLLGNLSAIITKHAHFRRLASPFQQPHDIPGMQQGKDPEPMLFRVSRASKRAFSC